MSQWYNLIVDDIENIPKCISYYEDQLNQSKYEVSLTGKSIETHSAELPGIVEYRYTQLQEIEAILEYLNISLRKLRSSVFRNFLEKYNRALTSRDADKYVDGDSSVCAYMLLVNEFALLRNKYLSRHKGLDIKNWQISNIVRLRVAGLDDCTLN